MTVKKSKRHNAIVGPYPVSKGVVGPYDLFEGPQAFDSCKDHELPLERDGFAVYCPECRVERAARDAALISENGDGYGTTIVQPYARVIEPTFLPQSVRLLVDELTKRGFEVTLGTSITRTILPPFKSGARIGQERPEVLVTWTYVDALDHAHGAGVKAAYKGTSFDSALVGRRGQGKKLVTLKGELDSWISGEET